MFTMLIESRHARQRHDGGTLVSLALHATLVTLAVQFTIGTVRPVDTTLTEQLIFSELAQAPPGPPTNPALRRTNEPGVHPTALPAKGFQVLVAPVKMPDGLPAIDIRSATTREEDFSGRGVSGGVAHGIAGGATRRVDHGQLHLQHEVDKAAEPFPENRPPLYPEDLQAMNIEGTVVVQFIVDTTGRADPASLKVLGTTHQGFVPAVRAALAQWRFHPAEVGGRKVRVLVRQPIEFTLAP